MKKLLVTIFVLGIILAGCTGQALLDHMEDLEETMDGTPNSNVYADGELIQPGAHLTPFIEKDTVTFTIENVGQGELYYIFGIAPFADAFDRSIGEDDEKYMPWDDSVDISVTLEDAGSYRNPGAFVELLTYEANTLNDDCLDYPVLITKNSYSYPLPASAPSADDSLIITPKSSFVLNEEGRLLANGDIINMEVSYGDSSGYFIDYDYDTPSVLKTQGTIKEITSLDETHFMCLFEDGRVGWFQTGYYNEISQYNTYEYPHPEDDFFPFYDCKIVISSTENSSHFGKITEISGALALDDDGKVWKIWDEDDLDFTPIEIDNVSMPVINAIYDGAFFVTGSDTLWHYDGSDVQEITAITNVAKVSGTGTNILILDGNSEVWSDNATGFECNIRSLTTEKLGPPWTNVADISISDNVAAVVLNDGSVYAWGNTDSPYYSALSSTPRLVSGIDSVINVEAGTGGDASYEEEEYITNILAVKSDGSVWTWAEGSIDNNTPTEIPGFNRKN